MQWIRLYLSFAFLLVAAVATSAQRVFVVDRTGGTHTSLQAAATAANDGDWIFWKSDSSTSARIDGKSLWIHGSNELRTPQGFTLSWRNHPRGRTSRITNVRAQSTPFAAGITPWTVDGAGNLFVEGVHVPGGLTVSLTGILHLRDATLGMPRDVVFLGVGGHGLKATCKELWIDGCSIHGKGRAGSSGAIVSAAHAVLVGSTIHGGTGTAGRCIWTQCTRAGTGGPALVLRNTRAEIHGNCILQSGFTGAYTHYFGTRPPFYDPNTTTVSLQNSDVRLGVTLTSQQLKADSRSSVTRPSSPLARLEFQKPFMWNRDVVIECAVAPREFVALLVALRARTTHFPTGTLSLDLASLLFPRYASANAQGIAQFRFQAGTSRDILGLPLLVQGVAITSSATLRFTNPSASVVVPE